MSKSRFNPLITASVMSAVYLAGISFDSQAVVEIQPKSDIAMDMTASFIGANNYQLPDANAQGQRRYIVQFKQPSVAMYNGAGRFAPIPRLSNHKIDTKSPAAQAYVSALDTQQTNFLSGLSSNFGRTVNALYSYKFAVNGLALYLSDAEASQVKSMADVKSIELDKEYFLNTDAGPTLIGANNVWNGTAPSTGTAFGEGVVLGIIDSGANFDHPSFADIGGDAYDHTNPLGSGNYLGVCDPTNVDQFDADYVCNDKLIGGFDFVDDEIPVGAFEVPGPEDENGHGTHTASTAGGNLVLTASTNGVDNIEISGVARHANIIAYDACYTSSAGQGLCPNVSTLASIDQIIADGVVDVVNYSIGGGTSPWNESVSQSFLAATDNGVFVSASAGNSGPGPGTLGHVEPWTSTVGASTHNRRFSNAVTVTGPGPVPPELVDMFGIQGTGPAMVVDLVGTMEYAGNIDGGTNTEGCAPFTDPLTGLVAVISRGSCSFADKVNNAEAAGAIGVIVHNNIAGAEPIVMGGLDTTNLPSVMVSQTDGLALDAFIDANPGAATVSVAATTSITLTGQADSMAGFSSRGPSPFEVNKPDVTGPGVSILAAFNDNEVIPSNPDEEYGVISGTSMSSPHNAGAAALLKELQPTWTTPEIKSALMMTAVTAGVTKEDATTPADPFDRGAGRIQVDLASSSGLVMHETAFDFLLADPANGGDPKDLNLASYKNDNCIGTCSFTRQFRSVASVPATYNASLSDVTGTVTPATFTVNPGQTVSLNIDVDGAALPTGVVSFGELVLQPVAPGGSFTVNPSLAITDAGYTSPTVGTAGMVCADVEVSGLSMDPFTTELTVSASHNDWLADLTMKIGNPGGDLLTVLNESSAGGGITLDAGIPIRFFDGAAASADTLGSDGGAFGGDPACTFDPCEFFPFPNVEASPPATFADISVGDPNGTWQVCMGDSAGGDTGVFESATVSILQGAAADVPDLHLPLVVTGFPETPEINVTPATLSASLDPDQTTDLTINVENTLEGTIDLSWTEGTGAINTTYVDQQADPDITANTGFAGNLYAGNGDIGAYIADDYTSGTTAFIETMFFEGFVTGGPPAPLLTDTATAFNVEIYANNDQDAPDGDPEGTTGTAIASLSIPINDPSLTIVDGNITVDVLAANGGQPLNIPAGSYWVSAFASQIGTNADPGAWVWFVAGDDPAGETAKLISPVLFGITAWTNAPSLFGPPNNVLFEKMRYSMTGPAGIQCGAPWISIAPTSGVLSPGSNEDVTVTLDSTGLAPGDYTGYVCIDSNDSDETRTVVQVDLTVIDTDLIFANSFD